MASKEDEDYMRRTNSAEKLTFSMPKYSEIGETALIFTHDGLIGRGKIDTKPEKSEEHPTHGDRPVWWGKIDGIVLLRKALSNKEVEDRMTPESQIVKKWIWYNHPHRSFNTPSDEHFRELERIFEEELKKSHHPRPKTTRPIQAEEDVKALDDEVAGYENDSAKRRSVEKWAMDFATKHYENEDFKVDDISPKKLGYDLRCRRKKEEVHVEVKGTTTKGAMVEVTSNEVDHARTSECPWRTDLFIVSNIKITKTKDGPKASGGVQHLIKNWKPKPNDKRLKPIRYRYTVPT